MKNSFFYTNKGEQAALILLILGIIALKSLCFDYWHLQHPRIQKRLAMDSARYELQALARQYKPGSGYEISKSVKLFSKTNKDFTETDQNLRETENKLPVSAHLQNFDPNLADSAQLRALGLSPFVCGNILKYRAMGGLFRQKSDLAKMYGLSQETYKRLKPYIVLQEAEQDEVSRAPEETDKIISSPTQKDQNQSLSARTPIEQRENRQLKKELSSADSVVVRPELYPAVCRINTADTADLMQYPGIGGYTAKRILDYRERLGGYCSPEQLDEIAGIYPENMRVLKQCLQTDSTEIRKLKLNYCSLEQFRSHPYLTFYQARSLVELRQSIGKISSPEDLLFLDEFKEQDLKRLLPYFDWR